MTQSLNAVLNPEGDVNVQVLASVLRMPVAQIAEAIGADLSAVDCAPTARDPDASERLRELVELLHVTVPWAGSVEMAWAHYRSYPIPALGSLTAEALLVRGRSEELSEYLRHIEDGGYA